ncbi:MAG: polysaccharide biosynthesis C-terminal domain-containing protein [Opitutaceae bacterium]|nr:polysaccharide biosynthesis C-terminal domain-containing protein [Cytophagales bacterium]
MIKLVVHTFATKAITAAISLAIVILTTHVLGLQGRGEITLITANIGIVLLLIQIVGGPSLVYLVPRSNPFHLFICAVLWSFVLPILLILFMQYIGIIEHGFFINLIYICVVYGLSSTCQLMLLSFEQINTYNILIFIQTLLHFLGLTFFFFVVDKADIQSFIWSLVICHSITLIIAVILLTKFLKITSFTNFFHSAKEAVIKGFTLQAENLVQFLNYRLSLFFLSSQLSNLGLFSISLVFTEAIWLFGNSLSLVQYSKISNEKNREESVNVSFKLAKINFWVTLICVVILSLFPEIIYDLVFGSGFGAARYPTLVLCPGILAIAVAMSFSQYFAGIGNFKLNNIAALVGLAIKIPACILLVPDYKEIGAALACTLSYSGSCIYLFYKFKNETGFKISYMFLTKQDIADLKILASKCII